MIDLDYLVSQPAAGLSRQASQIRDEGFGSNVSYSRKVFIPLTSLCRDVCHYCTYAKTPKAIVSPYLSPDEVLEIARKGESMGCKEALFTLGDKPELRYSTARKALISLGYDSTIDYVEASARLVLEQTGLLPHLNPGVLTAADYDRLRPVSASMGMMLESGADRLAERGGPHFGSPDKVPATRFKAIREAGEAGVPFTTGLLIGIGETRADRLADLLKLHRIQQEHGHIQDLIIQPFRAKPNTRMSAAPEPALEELLWTISAARIVFGPTQSIQAPPNLSSNDELEQLIAAGINDWGGVSPVTPDHVNPEAPWPHISELEARTNAAGKNLVERLALTPTYVRQSNHWSDPSIRPKILKHADADGFARTDRWTAGLSKNPPDIVHLGRHDPTLAPLIRDAAEGVHLPEAEIARLFRARGSDVAAIAEAADHVRKSSVGDNVTYVVNRNLNYTNICLYRCEFCAFSKGRGRDSLRGKPYRLDLADVTMRVREAVERGATEICMQGGIHPEFTGETYLDILNAARDASPDIHIHAFSPLEVTHGARSLGLPLGDFLTELKRAGLASLPGTAAEVLHEDVRKVLCPDKVTSEEWLDVMRTAHRVGLRSTATIMFGHIDAAEHWARHLDVIRNLQEETGGFTEFVPLPFVHMQAPIAMAGHARPGPTWRESVLMHAVSRLVFQGLIDNIQASWVKLGTAGAQMMLNYGANDLGGVLMNESITSSAGASHGQQQGIEVMERLIRDTGRVPQQRTTTYGSIKKDGGDHANVASISESKTAVFRSATF